jgi:predicted MFS family arabinose efflux permease
VLAAAAACFVTGESLPVGLLPQMAASFHTSLTATGLLVTVYALVIIVVSAPLTHLTREVPRRFLLTAILLTFSLGTLACAAAPNYGLLMGARIFTALSQALFWATAPVAAAGLFGAEVRSRAVAGFFAGSSLAVVVGVPAGTWLGQRTGWQVPFLVLAGIGLLGAAMAVWLLPSGAPSDSHAATGESPDTRRYRILVIATALTVCAFYAFYTYITAFLTKVSGVARHDVAFVLLASGIASTIGIQIGGLLNARRPTLAVMAPILLLSAALLGLWGLGTQALPASALQACMGFALGAFVVAAQTGVLVYAPRGTDIATAWYSVSFNVGIGAGPLVGGLVLAGAGLRSTALVGALLAAAALTVTAGLRGVRPRPLAPASQ